MIVPVIPKNTRVIGSDIIIFNNYAGVTVAENALARPVHARHHDLLAIKYKTFVVHVILDFDMLEIDPRRLQGVQSAFEPFGTRSKQSSRRARR